MLATTAAALPLALAAGCSASPAVRPAHAAVTSARSGYPLSPGPGPQTLSETGSTLLYPLFRTWATAYHAQHSQVTIPTGATGSGAGIAGASAGTVDIGASDAYLSSGDLVQNPRLLNIPLAISAQQVYYNVPGLSPGAHLRLNAQVLAEMYQGKITRWNNPAIGELNPRVRLPDTPVVPLHRSDSSGDTFLFTSYLSATDTAWSNAYRLRHLGGLAQHRRRRPGPAGKPGHGRRLPGHCPAAWPTSASATPRRPTGLGEAQLARTGRATTSCPRRDHHRGGVPLRFVDAAERDHLDGRRPGRPGLPHRQLRVRDRGQHRQPTAARARDLRAFLHWVITAGQSTRYLDDFGSGPLPPSIRVPAPARLAGDALRRADRGD